MAKESYEEMMARVKESNEEHLAHFTNDLILERKMGKNKAHEHAERLRFFGNEYLLNYREGDLIGGLGSFASFVGDWFIRKCMWSDAEAVRKNVESFRLWVRYVRESGQFPKDEREGLEEELDEELETWCRRAEVYNDPALEPEDLFDEDGMWNDEAFSKKTVEQGPNLIPGTGRLVLNLLLSAKVSKFVGIKPPQLVKLANWGDLDSPEHRWFSNWRCEECFGMEGTKEKVLMITNLQTRYSVLIKIAGKDPKAFLVAVHAAIMRAFDGNGVARPGKIELEIATLSGAARSVTSFQNQQMYAIDHIMDRPEVKYLDDAEAPLNRVPTKIGGISDCHFPYQVFAEQCQKDPPFGEKREIDNIVPFLN